MSRTKTRQRPAPRRRTNASRKEIRVLIPGHALGEQAFLLMRRRAGRWSVTDSFRGAPAFVGVGEVWRELKPDTAEADLYCWPEAKARALVRRFVEDAVVVARNNNALTAAAEAAETARRLEELAAAMTPGLVVPEVVSLQYMGERLREAEAEAAARSRRAAPAAEGISVPAARDHPDWQPKRRDTVSLQQPLTLLGGSIPANWEDETVALDVLRVHGPAQTAVLPVVAQRPPMPQYAPTVHLTHLSETHPSTGERIRQSVAERLEPEPDLTAAH